MRAQLSGFNGAWQHHSTAYMVANLNRLLFATTAPEKYATFYFAIYNEARHALTYTNAGHLSPMLLRDGNLSLLEPTGTVVGAFAAATYEERTVCRNCSSNTRGPIRRKSSRAPWKPWSSGPARENCRTI